VPPLNSIHETIQHYQWTYLYTYACIVLTRLVRLFYANLEVAQDDERGTVLQSTVDGHIITVDPRSSVNLSGNLFSIYLPVHPTRWCFLPLWMSSENFSMLLHRVRSIRPPSRLVL
jgi:hypothetical protein